MADRAECPRAVGLIEFVDGRLPDDEIEDWGQHLERCSVCQAQFEILSSQSTPSLSADPGPSTPHLATARQQLLDSGRPGPSETRDVTETEVPPSTTQDSPDAAAPQRIGQYSDLQLIGRGGMGIVYRAFDDVLRRAVAIKQLSPHLAASAQARERFVREAQAAAAVVHEHVVAIHSVEEVSGVPFIVMQFVSGENLQVRIDRAGPLELRETLRIGIEIAQGLAAAHAGGVVHRDIKPSNILLENGLGRVKITDFGLARVAAASGLTQKGEAPGTPQYMSAEQARGESVDSRSDLFSLGSVLYAMSTGRPPFEADTVLGTLRQVADLPARPIRELNPDVPDWLAGIIARLHAKSPDERYQTAEEVATILLAHLDDAQPPRATRRRRWRVAAAVAVFAALAACEFAGVSSVIPALARIGGKADALATASPDTQAPAIVAADAVAQDPADIRSVLGRAQMHAARDELDQAIADYTQLISIAGPGPQRSSALTRRAQIYAQRGDWQAVIDDYCRFIDDNKNDTSGAVIWSQLASVYVCGPESLQNPQKALELAQAIVRVSPTPVGYRNILAAALYRSGQYREAAQMLEQTAREQGGRSQFNQIFLAMTWHQLGATDNARHCYASALEIDVHNAFYIPLQRLLRAEAEALLEIKPRED